MRSPLAAALAGSVCSWVVVAGCGGVITPSGRDAGSHEATADGASEGGGPDASAGSDTGADATADTRESEETSTGADTSSDAPPDVVGDSGYDDAPADTGNDAPPACGLTTCPNGCCENNTCVAYASQSTSKCGTGGVACAPCAGSCDATSGRCVVTLASGGSSWGIAVDSTSVYWADNAGMVMKVPLGGGSPTTLASGQAYPCGIAVDSTSVYWTSGGNSGPGAAVMKATPK